MRRLRLFARCLTTSVATLGWGCAIWAWVHFGAAAGINAGFITALSVGICFTILAGQWFLIPTRAELKEDQTVYALGIRHGLGCGACPLRPTPKESARLELIVN